MDKEQRAKVLEEAMKNMTPAERRKFADDYADYVTRKEVRSRPRKSDFKPINFDDVLGQHLKKG